MAMIIKTEHFGLDFAIFTRIIDILHDEIIFVAYTAGLAFG